jgi:hypothetical protein
MLYYVNGTTGGDRQLLAVSMPTASVQSSWVFPFELHYQQLEIASQDELLLGESKTALKLNTTSGSTSDLTFPPEFGVLWASSPAQGLILFETRQLVSGGPLRIEAISAKDGATTFKGADLPMVCANGAYSCYTSFFRFEDVPAPN